MLTQKKPAVKKATEATKSNAKTWAGHTVAAAPSRAAMPRGVLCLCGGAWGLGMRFIEHSSKDYLIYGSQGSPFGGSWQSAPCLHGAVGRPRVACSRPWWTCGGYQGGATSLFPPPVVCGRRMGSGADVEQRSIEANVDAQEDICVACHARRRRGLRTHGGSTKSAAAFSFPTYGLGSPAHTRLRLANAVDEKPRRIHTTTPYPTFPPPPTHPSALCISPTHTHSGQPRALSKT